jgi:DNA (cytosine-5)-methyltransferase 1
MLYSDIRKLKNPTYADIICGGFPCQDISITRGHAKGIKGKKSGLWKEMARIISEVRPKYVIIENSPLLLKRGFEKVLKDLSQIGYVAQWHCFRASDFGLPHQRERLYVVAYPDPMGWQASGMVGSRAHHGRGNPKAQRPQYPAVFERESLSRFAQEKSKAVPRQPQPLFCRMDDGIPFKLDRVKALGNAIVPCIAEYIFQRIALMEKAIPIAANKIAA